MIIDNVDDMSVLDGLSETESCSILKYIPNNAAGSILYTTRSKKNALRLTGEGNIIQISEMSMEDSKSLLRSKLRAETSNEELWIDLLEALERLPLAIVQAASYIRQNSWSISKYLRHFQSQDGNASIQFLQHDFQDKTREHTVANPVFKTWMITVRQLEDQHPRAAEALWLMAFYNRQNIPRYLLLNLTQPPPSNLLASDRRDDVQVVSQPEVKEDAELSLDLAIGTLVAYSFINVSDTERGENYTLHRLVHKFTRYWLKDYRRTADSWATKSLEFLSKEIPPFTYENWTKVTELLPHVEIILSYQPASHLPARGLGVLLSAAAYCSRAKAQYPLAEEYIRRAITTLSAALGAEDPLTMQARYFLALVCLDAGRYKEAEDTFRVLVRYLSDTLGENHEKVFFASSDLSNTLRVQKRYKEAEELATRAVFVLEKLYSPEAMRLLESKRILSTILTDMGEYKKAIEIQRAIWEVTQKEYGPEHPEPMLMKHNLAVTLANMGELEEARRMSQDVLKWNEKLLGPDHPLTINILFNLAYTLDREGNFAEAEDYYRRVLEHHLCYPGINDIEIIRCLRNLALCSESQNFYDEAAKYYHQAYERIRTLPDAKEAYADEILDDLARLSILQGNDTDAIEKSQEAEKQKLKAKELEAPESEGTSAGGRNRSRKWLGRAFYPYSPGSRNGKPG